MDFLYGLNSLKTSNCISVREGVRKKLLVAVRSVRNGPPRSAKAVLCGLWGFFYNIFLYAYQKIQNGITRMFLLKEKKIDPKKLEKYQQLRKYQKSV